MSLQLKAGVRALGLRPEALLAVLVADGVWAERGKVLTVTSCTDGKHSAGSLHYKGLAVDLRSVNLTEEERGQMLAALKERLGAEYDAILEGDHFHVEYDPKT